MNKAKQVCQIFVCLFIFVTLLYKNNYYLKINISFFYKNNNISLFSFI